MFRQGLLGRAVKAGYGEDGLIGLGSRGLLGYGGMRLCVERQLRHVGFRCGAAWIGS